MLEPRPAGFTKATVTAWRVALEACGLGPISINIRTTAVTKLAVEAADNGLLAPELASGITRIKATPLALSSARYASSPLAEAEITAAVPLLSRL